MKCQVFWPILYGKKINFEIFNFLDKLDDSEHFLKKIFFLKILQVFWPILYEKINFKIFSFLDQSDDSEHFFKGYYFWVFCPAFKWNAATCRWQHKVCNETLQKRQHKWKKHSVSLIFPLPAFGKKLFSCDFSFSPR